MSTSVPFVLSQTLSTLRDMAPARIGNRLFVRPLLENLAEAQHEHDGACRIEIAAHKRNGDSRGIKHSNGEMTVRSAYASLSSFAER